MKKTIYFCGITLALNLIASGCGDDPSLYRGESLTFQSPVSAKTVKNDSKDSADVDLATDASSDFLFTRIGALAPAPFNLYPIWDYYAEPIAIEVPVSPFYSLIEYLPPMYYNYYYNPFFSDDDE